MVHPRRSANFHNHVPDHLEVSKYNDGGGWWEGLYIITKDQLLPDAGYGLAPWLNMNSGKERRVGIMTRTPLELYKWLPVGWNHDKYCETRDSWLESWQVLYNKWLLVGWNHDKYCTTRDCQSALFLHREHVPVPGADHD